MPMFDDFLRSGRIGQISVGMNQEAVRELWGPPQDTSIRKHPEIWKYGPVEFSFYRSPEDSSLLLVSIIYHFSQPNAEPPRLLSDSGWMPNSETSIEEFRGHLVDVGIAVVGGVASGPHQHLVLDSSSRVTFEEGKLSSVGFSAKQESKIKQVSISVPQEDFEAIRREAKILGISANALCSRLISEHVSSLKPQEA